MSCHPGFASWVRIVAFVGVAWTPLVLHAQTGTVLREQKIDGVQGGFTGELEAQDFFGHSVASPGDVDGDGVRDLAVGAYGDDDGGEERGAVWILFMNADGTVRSQAKISSTQGGFGAPLVDLANFGYAMTGLGDLDGDGIGELAVAGYGAVDPPWTGIAGRTWILFLRPDGSVRSHVEIRHSHPAFVPPIAPAGFVGLYVTGPGDVDEDGIPDLVIGSPEAQAGAIWVVRLNADGTPKSAQKIDNTGLTQPIIALGYLVSALGDLDGDGNVELASWSQLPFPRGSLWILYLGDDDRVAGQRQLFAQDFGFPPDQILPKAGPGDLDGDGVVDLIATSFLRPTPISIRPALGLGFLGADGSVQKRLVVTEGIGGFTGPVDPIGAFGFAIASLGDLDGDGGIELAAGDPNDDAVSEQSGAVWVLSLDPSAVRNGSGANPLTLSQKEDPRLGADWLASLDCRAHAPGSALLIGSDRPVSGVFVPAGELLVDLAGSRLFTLLAPHAGTSSLFTTPVPLGPALFGRVLHVQGLCTGAPGLRLGNALDVIVGR